jgi:hypothetical protein
MQYDYHSEYPVTLKYDPENGVTGIWYQNQLKGIEQMFEELETFGHAEELAKIRAYMGTDTDFAKMMEVSRRLRHLVVNTKAMNGLHVVEIIGKTVFEPLSNPNWGVTGTMSVEFEILNDRDPELDTRYSVHLDGELVVGLSKWNGQAWVQTEEVIIPYGTDMHQLFEGRDCTTTPVRPKGEPTSDQ